MYNKFFKISFCISLLFPLQSFAQEKEINKIISPKLFAAFEYASKFDFHKLNDENIALIEQKYLDAFNSKEKDAAISLGRFYVSTNQIKKSIPIFEQDFLNGNNEAAIAYAFNIQKILPYDCAKAREYLIKAENNGHEKAQEFLADFYAKGKCGDTNVNKAFEYNLKAANRGLKGAQFLTSSNYFYGYGIEKDYVKALAWLNITNENQSRVEYVIFNSFDIKNLNQNINVKINYVFMGKSKAKKYQAEICATTKACSNPNH